MAGQYPEVIGEIEDPAAHGFDQLIPRTAWKIGPSDTASEQLIPGKEHAFIDDFETHVTGGVPGRVPNPQAEPCHFEDVGVDEVNPVDRCPVLTGRSHPEQRTQLILRRQREEIIIRMDPALHAE